MEGKFKIKFDNKDSYLKGTADFLRLLSTWRDNESKFSRDFALTPITNDASEIYELEVSLNVEKK